MNHITHTFVFNNVDLLSRYCQNIENARETISQVGENHPAIIKCQRALGHTLPLSSYLLKPVQRWLTSTNCRPYLKSPTI